MEQIIITHIDGTTLKLQSRQNASTITRAVQSVEWLSADTVNVSVESAAKLDLRIGDKITVIGRDYTMNTPPQEKKLGERHFVYEIQFEGVQYDLLRASYSLNVDTTSSQIQDVSSNALTGDLKRFLDVLIANVNRVFPGKWVLGNYPENTETRTETFAESDNCLSVLQTLCSESKYNTAFNITIDGSGTRTLDVGEMGNTMPYTFEYGRGKGIYELTREKLSNSNIITRLYVYGSSKNINTSKYRALNLCLPGKNKAQSYLESAAGISAYGVWEATKVFEDIFPHRTGAVSALGSSELQFRDSSMDFDLNAEDVNGNSLYLLAGTPAKVKFNTGNLAGYEFEVESYNHATQEFTLKAMTDENDYRFPSTDTAAFQFAVGDEYVLIDIYMPQTYETAEEAKLQSKGQEYLDKYSQPRVQYSLSLDRFFLRDIVGAGVGSNVIWVGDYIPIKDSDIQVDKTIRVKGFTRDLMDLYSYTLTIADQSMTVSVISRIVSDLRGVDKIIKFNSLNDPAKARRSYLSAQEVLNMIFDPEGDFYTDKIKPLSIDTTMLSVGAKSMQFGLEGTIIQPTYGGNKNRVVYTGGTITHYAIVDGTGNPRSWTVANGDITLGSDAAYYLYVKAQKVGTGATLLFSTSKISVESDQNYYHFLIGIINSVDTNNARALALMYGFTTINGRFIKTGRITSNDGTRYFDLDTGVFKGSFQFTNGTNVETAVNDAQDTADSALSTANSTQNYINNVLPSELTDLQNQIDGVVDSWFYAYSPTTSNYPASEWTTSALKERHVGDTFTNTQEYVDEIFTPDAGKSWRWVNNAGVYSWSPIADSDAVKALLMASQAQDTADNKRRVFTTTPFTPYEVGDLWVQGTSGDIMSCQLSRLSGNYSSSDWVKASKYTDDTTANSALSLANSAWNNAQDAANLADSALVAIDAITSDSVLSAVEKPGERSRWNDVYNEKAGINSQAAAFGLTTQNTAYNTAFQALATYLNNGSTWSSGIPSWLSDANLSVNTSITGATYRSKWNDLFSAKQTLLNAIYAKAKLLADNAQSAANNAQTAANNAATAASNAQTSANSALSQITNITADNVLSAAEKPSQRLAWNTIAAEKAGIDAQADTFGVSKTSYGAAFQSLANYLNNGTTWSSGVPAWLSDANLSVNTSITGATYRANWQAYYDARTALLNAIAAKAKELADQAQDAADGIQIGGRNLYFNSSYYGGTGNWFSYNVSNAALSTDIPPFAENVKSISWKATYITSPYYSGYYQRFRSRTSSVIKYFKSGQQYTVSVWLKASSAMTFRIYPEGITGSNTYVQLTTEWQKFSVSFMGNGTSHTIIFYGIINSPDITAYMCMPKLEEGNRATDWTPAPEDVDAKITALDYLKTALEGSTDISGGLLATNVLLMKTLAGVITGGMSGLNNDNIGVWTGGTYQNAIDSLAKIILRKDGSGQLAGGKILFDALGALLVGAFNIEGGSIVGYSGSKERVKFHTGDIETLANLIAGSWTQASDTYNIGFLEQAIENTSVSPLPVSRALVDTGYLTVPANTNVKLNPGTITATLGGPYSAKTESKYYKVYKDGSLVGTYTASTVNTVTLVAGGTYFIEFHYDLSFVVAANSTVTLLLNQSADAYITSQFSVEKTEIGKNGFYSYWSNILYLYFSQSDGLKIKGNTDTPGVLAAGDVASGGTTTTSWGAKKGASSKSAGGTYVISHTIGHTNYYIQLTPKTAGRLVYISAKTTTSCTVVITNTSGSAIDTAFEYAIMGNN